MRIVRNWGKTSGLRLLEALDEAIEGWTPPKDKKDKDKKDLAPLQGSGFECELHKCPENYSQNQAAYRITKTDGYYRQEHYILRGRDRYVKLKKSTGEDLYLVDNTFVELIQCYNSITKGKMTPLPRRDCPPLHHAWFLYLERMEKASEYEKQGEVEKARKERNKDSGPDPFTCSGFSFNPLSRACKLCSPRNFGLKKTVSTPIMTYGYERPKMIEYELFGFQKDFQINKCTPNDSELEEVARIDLSSVRIDDVFEKGTKGEDSIPGETEAQKLMRARKKVCEEIATGEKDSKVALMALWCYPRTHGEQFSHFDFDESTNACVLKLLRGRGSGNRAVGGLKEVKPILTTTPLTMPRNQEAKLRQAQIKLYDQYLTAQKANSSNPEMPHQAARIPNCAYEKIWCMFKEKTFNPNLQSTPIVEPSLENHDRLSVFQGRLPGICSVGFTNNSEGGFKHSAHHTISLDEKTFEVANLDVCCIFKSFGRMIKEGEQANGEDNLSEAILLFRQLALTAETGDGEIVTPQEPPSAAGTGTPPGTASASSSGTGTQPPPGSSTGHTGTAPQSFYQKSNSRHAPGSFVQMNQPPPNSVPSGHNPGVGGLGSGVHTAGAPPGSQAGPPPGGSTIPNSGLIGAPPGAPPTPAANQTGVGKILDVFRDYCWSSIDYMLPDWFESPRKRIERELAAQNQRRILPPKRKFYLAHDLTMKNLQQKVDAQRPQEASAPPSAASSPPPSTATLGIASTATVASTPGAPPASTATSTSTVTSKATPTPSPPPYSEAELKEISRGCDPHPLSPISLVCSGNLYYDFVQTMSRESDVSPLTSKLRFYSPLSPLIRNMVGKAFHPGAGQPNMDNIAHSMLQSIVGTVLENQSRLPTGGTAWNSGGLGNLTSGSLGLFRNPDTAEWLTPWYGFAGAKSENDEEAKKTLVHQVIDALRLTEVVGLRVKVISNKEQLKEFVLGDKDAVDKDYSSGGTEAVRKHRTEVTRVQKLSPQQRKQEREKWKTEWKQRCERYKEWKRTSGGSGAPRYEVHNGKHSDPSFTGSPGEFTAFRWESPGCDERIKWSPDKKEWVANLSEKEKRDQEKLIDETLWPQAFTAEGNGKKFVRTYIIGFYTRDEIIPVNCNDPKLGDVKRAVSRAPPTPPEEGRRKELVFLPNNRYLYVTVSLCPDSNTGKVRIRKSLYITKENLTRLVERSDGSTGMKCALGNLAKTLTDLNQPITIEIPVRLYPVRISSTTSSDTTPSTKHYSVVVDLPKADLPHLEAKNVWNMVAGRLGSMFKDKAMENLSRRVILPATVALDG